MTEAQKIRFAELRDKEALTTAEKKELKDLTALKTVELEAKKQPEKPQIKGFSIGTNGNYSQSIDEKTAVESVGLIYAKPINKTLIINSVTKVTRNEQSFYSVKADDLQDTPIDLTVSLHHYESFSFSTLLPIGSHTGKVLRVKVVEVTTNHGYFDKIKQTVIRYWRDGIFIVEPRAELSEREIKDKTEVTKESATFKATLDLLCGGVFNSDNAKHLEILSKLQR